MARQNQNPAMNVGQASASALSDNDETPTPVAAPAPEISAAEQIAALQAQIAALTATQPENQIVPGGTIRPTAGVVHATLGTPIFNVNRPTGRAG